MDNQFNAHLHNLPDTPHGMEISPGLEIMEPAMAAVLRTAMAALIKYQSEAFGIESLIPPSLKLWRRKEKTAKTERDSKPSVVGKAAPQHQAFDGPIWTRDAGSAINFAACDRPEDLLLPEQRLREIAKIFATIGLRMMKGECSENAQVQ